MRGVAILNHRLVFHETDLGQRGDERLQRHVAPAGAANHRLHQNWIQRAQELVLKPAQRHVLRLDLV